MDTNPEIERIKVASYIHQEVEDWDDEQKSRSRFKAMSGQTQDYEWQTRYIFWKNLIINVAKHLNVFIIHPNQLQHVWFRRGHLSPLCIDQVLVEMYKNGELLRSSDLVDPKSGPLSQMFRKVFHRVGLSSRGKFSIEGINEEFFIVLPLLKEKSVQVLNVLSESHWTPSCVVTLNKFEEICGGPKEASLVLSHLSENGKARYLQTQSKDPIEGVKVALATGALCTITSLDHDVLHLLWTVDRLGQQLNVIDGRCKSIKELATVSLKMGNRTSALRHARELKLASQGREKCITLLNRVEEVLGIISDAESSKKVSEAIIIGARAMKENRISAQEVQQSLEELDESIASQKQVDKLLETSYMEVEDEDIEDELKQLEIDIAAESVQAPIDSVAAAPDSSVGVQDASETSDSLSSALSKLDLMDNTPTISVLNEDLESSTPRNVSRTATLEAA
ncbi:membrane traffic protein [Lithospermum erythrorhizon]|uniref:Membrane traffic protein n=1 Tax=Lithospermum erythrorhizon TaxID=34254 RepID=A0AAV3NKL2_LITER